MAKAKASAPKPHKLTWRTVKRKAREAYRARKLTAQHRNADQRVGSYRVGAYNCAIGAGMPKTLLDRIDDANALCFGVNELVFMKLISVEPGELRKMSKLQSAHDEWAEASRKTFESPEFINDRRASFLAALEL